ncbi:hypothetical protein V1506DRAFT_574248 [Lipomyces tetrasporus]
MAPRSKRSRNAEANARKRYQVDAEDCNVIGDEVDVEYIEVDERAIVNRLHALDQLSYFPEADNSLRYTAHRGGSVRTQQLWKAKFKTNIQMKSLFN